MNKFKFATLRQFSSENVSFSSEIESENEFLTPEQIEGQIKQIDTLINRALIACVNREITESDLLAESANRRAEGMRKRNIALQNEVNEKSKAELTVKEAEKISKRFDEINNKK